MSSLFPTYARFPITLVKGEGSRLWDDQGKEYLDFCSGLAVTNLGHAHPKVTQKVAEQLDQLWHVSNLFHIPNQEQLAKKLTDISCTDAVFFCNSGAEANEAAIKLARKYNQKILKNERSQIITFQNSFHGRTMATLSATGQDKVKEGYAPLLEGFVTASYNDVSALKDVVTDQTCAIMLELVQAEGGVHSASVDFVQEIKRLCEKHELLLIVDEIQTGIGRTGTMFSYERYAIEPDIITLAKGLGNGFPIGAMLGKKKLIDAFGPGSHGSTFGGTPIATKAGLAVLDIMIEEKLPQRAAKLGERAHQKLKETLHGNSFVKEIRGQGLLIGIECIKPVGEIITAAQEKGLLILSAGPQVIRLLPNLLVTEEDLDRGLDILCGLLSQMTVTSE